VPIAVPSSGVRRRVVGLLLAAVALAGCATPPSDPAARAAFVQTNDPLEPLNRKVFDFNQLLDRILLRPVTKLYIAVLPEAGRDAVQHALDNMKEPVVAINNVLQGRPKGAGIAIERLIVNTTIGVAGFLDVAKKWGLEPQTGDFGQTLYVWGFPQGPYLILPILGPSNPRDAIGMVADNYIDPFSYVASAEGADDIQITRFVLGGIDERARAMDLLDDLQKNSLDFYAQLRSVVEQHRAAELRHGAAPPPSANFYDVPADSAAPPAAPPPTSSRP
jgi:phospholipid-binding lipoprotein MlaA